MYKQNPIYNYTAGTASAPLNQVINTYSRTNSYETTISYLQPIGKFSFLEFNYAFNTNPLFINKLSLDIQALVDSF